MTTLLQVSPQEAATELLRRRKARNSLIDFCQFTFPLYEVADHLQTIASRLEAIECGEIKRLMIFAPPGHGKSELASIRFPAWYLGRNPQDQIIGCSYADSLAYINSFAVRAVIDDEAYQRLWPCVFETLGVEQWQLLGKIDNRPSYIAAGIGSGITGKRANLIIIDDPVKDPEHADSQAYQEKCWGWYTNVVRTRLLPAGAIVLIMTRWRVNDLAGRLLKQARANPQADQWEILHLKAVEDGQALWSTMYPVEALEGIRSTIGSRDFEALYQGSPMEAEGNVFKREWWRYYKVRPSFKRLILSWDTAFKEKQGNDYSVCQLWGEAENGYYLIDLWRGRVEFPELKQMFIAAFNRDRPNVVLVEDAASGQSLIQEMRRSTAIPLKAIKPDKDKVARANAITPLIEAGRVCLPEYAPWLFDYLAELSAFPAGEHDDQVDATTQALNYMGHRITYDVSFV